MHQTLYIALIATVSVCIFHACVNAEQCTTNTDCGSGSTNCKTGYHIVCQHPSGAGIASNGGLCTCAVDNLTCKTQSDCQTLNLASFQCISDGHKHCYDNKCICTRW